jgi:peptidoglycan/xylan/chitin deacetylase (PgdA/CDA1 family)
MTDWAPLVAALDDWNAQGRVARFWLRDDDAVEPTPALDRLLGLNRDHAVPITLAVIPAHVQEALAALLGNHPDVTVALHGWSHENHAPAHQKKQELGAHRPTDVVLSELAAGFDRLNALFGRSFVPVLVPPWNRIDKALLPGLPQLGLSALSVFGAEKSGPVPEINTHADIMDWHGTRGCRPGGDIVADILKRMDEMQRSGGAMGLLTHHLVHDEAAWQFIHGLLSVTAGHPACRWCSLPDLLITSSGR